jgi:hypothetical protein
MPFSTSMPAPRRSLHRLSMKNKRVTSSGIWAAYCRTSRVLGICRSTQRQCFGARTFDYMTEGHPKAFYTHGCFRLLQRQIVFRPTFANKLVHRRSRKSPPYRREPARKSGRKLGLDFLSLISVLPTRGPK